MEEVLVYSVLRRGKRERGDSNYIEALFINTYISSLRPSQRLTGRPGIYRSSITDTWFVL